MGCRLLRRGGKWERRERANPGMVFIPCTVKRGGRGGVAAGTEAGWTLSDSAAFWRTNDDVLEVLAHI